VLEKIRKAKYNKYQPEEQLLERIILSLPETLEAKTYYRYIGEGLNILTAGSAFGRGLLVVSITGKQAKILRSGLQKAPDYSDFVTKELEKVGRLRDPDYMVDGVAYKYGSKWLKEEIPADVIDIINSWEEVKSEESLISKLAKKYIKSYTEVEPGKIKVTLKSEATFDFSFGSAVTPTPEMMLDALLQDAEYGKDGFEAALEECLGMGFEGKAAIKVAKALVKQYEKAVKCGVWDEYLEVSEK